MGTNASYIKFRSILKSLDTCMEYIEKKHDKGPEEYIFLFDDIVVCVSELNKNLFGFPEITHDVLLEMAEKIRREKILNWTEFKGEYGKWKDFVNERISFREGLATNIDRDFYYLMDYARYVKFENIRNKCI